MFNSRKSLIRFATSFFFIQCVLIVAPGIVSYAQGGPGQVKIGVLAKRGPERCLEKWGPTAEYLTSEIPEHSFIIVPLDFNEVLSAVERGEVDFILVNPSFYVELEIQYEVECLATLIELRKGAAYPVYGGVVFCRNDREDIKEIRDLKGKKFMSVAENSLGGWRMVWREMKKAGIDPNRNFFNLRFGGTHDAVIYAVRDGVVDAGAVRTDALERLAAEGKIDLEDFRVLGKKQYEHFPFLCSTVLYPEWPFARLAQTSEELAQKVKNALLRMPPESPAAESARISGWTIPLSYQPVRECLRELHVGPYKVGLRDFFQRYWWQWFLAAISILILMSVFTIYVLLLNRRLKRFSVELTSEMAERKRAEEALRETRDFLENLVGHANAPIIVWDPDNRITRFNRAFERLAGCSAEEVVGQELSMLFPESKKEESLGEIARATGGDYWESVEIPILCKNGKTRFVLWNSANIYSEDGATLLATIAQGVDITERRQAEEALRQSEEKHRLFFENAPIGIIHYDDKGVITNVNEAMIDIFGSSREKLIGLDIKEIPDEEFASQVKTSLKGKHVKYEGWYTSYTGRKTAFIKASWIPIRQDCELFSGVGIIEDITDRKQAEEALRESEAKYRLLAENTQDCIWMINTEFEFTYVNSAIQAMLGFTIEEWVGSALFDHCPPEEKPRILTLIENYLKSRVFSEIKLFEMSLYRKDGTLITVEISVKAIIDNNGAFKGFQGCTRDITGRKQAEEALRESENRHRHLCSMVRLMCDNLPELIWAKDLENRFIFVNKACCEKLLNAKDTDEPIGKTDLYFANREKESHPENSEYHTFGDICTGSDLAVMSTKKPQRFDESGNVKGRFLYLDVYKAPLGDEKGNMIGTVGCGRDITREKRIEEERKQAKIERERLMSAIEQSSEVIVITDSQAKITFVNPAFEKITGYSREEAIGQNPRILQSGKHDEAFYHELWETLTNGKTWTGHFINTKKDGSLYTEEASISPVYSTSGEIINYVAVKRDISEEIKLEEQLRQSQKMESVGLLAGGVAHDFNNTLTPILGYADLALMGLNKNDPFYNNLKEIRDSAMRASALTHQLLAFSRKQMLTLNVINLNETITSFNKMLHRLIGEDIELVTFLEPSLGNIKADENQIQQVLMNLAVNAREAMHEGGNITIETANVYLDEEYARTHTNVQPGEYVMLALSDSGHGMDADTRDRIFEPFFTTKEVGKGTGLGLSTVYGIVKQHEGDIWVYSEPDKGTIIKIYLPRLESSEEAAVEKEPYLKETFGTETVLVVEDDADVRKLACTILSAHGYNIIEACDGKEAMSIARRHKSFIHLLFTDVIMPEMKGRELYERLSKKRPDMKVLYMSGYTDNVIAHHGILDPETQFLQKPFSLNGLLQKVRETLVDM